MKIINLILFIVVVVLAVFSISSMVGASHPCREGESQAGCEHWDWYGIVGESEDNEVDEKKNESMVDDNNSEESGGILGGQEIDRQQNQNEGHERNQNEEGITDAFCFAPIRAYSNQPYLDQRETDTFKYLTEECPKQLDQDACWNLTHAGEYEEYGCRWIKNGAEIKKERKERPEYQNIANLIRYMPNNAEGDKFETEEVKHSTIFRAFTNFFGNLSSFFSRG